MKNRSEMNCPISCQLAATETLEEGVKYLKS